MAGVWWFHGFLLEIYNMGSCVRNFLWAKETFIHTKNKIICPAKKRQLFFKGVFEESLNFTPK